MPLVVTTPPTSGVPLGPTGQVANTGTGFVLPNGSPALFIFSTLAGSIDGWNGLSGTVATLFPGTAGAVYTGLALANNGSGNFLYAANFGGGRIDVFNSSFGVTTLSGTFTDPNLPAGYAPFGIRNLNNQIFVAFAPRNPASRARIHRKGAPCLRLCQPRPHLRRFFRRRRPRRCRCRKVSVRRTRC